MGFRLLRGPLVAAAILCAAGVLGADQEEDSRALAQYKLTHDNIKRLRVALRALVDLVEKSPQIAQQMGGPEQETLDQAINRIESNPTFAGVLKDAGISARDYLLSSVAVVMADAVRQALKSDPKSPMPPEVPPENLAMVEAHDAEVTAVLKELDRFAEKTGIR